MAQRGGSVVTFVRYGEKVAEPIVEEGMADVLIAFERLEALRYAHFLKKDASDAHDHNIFRRHYLSPAFTNSIAPNLPRKRSQRTRYP